MKQVPYRWQTNTRQRSNRFRRQSYLATRICAALA